MEDKLRTLSNSIDHFVSFDEKQKQAVKTRLNSQIPKRKRMKIPYTISAFAMASIFLLFIGATLLQSNPNNAGPAHLNGITVEQALEKGHIVIQNESTNVIELVRDGKVNSTNLQHYYQFKDAIKNGEKSSLAVSIFNVGEKRGKTNLLTFDGHNIHFTNNYDGYEMETGSYTCENLIIGGRTMVSVTNCESINSTQTLDSILVFTASLAQFKEAEALYKSNNE